MLINSRESLLDPNLTPGFARGLAKVIADASVSGSACPHMYIRSEPLLVKACGIEVTPMHAGRSSQDIHTTFQRAMLRDLACCDLAAATQRSPLRASQACRGQPRHHRSQLHERFSLLGQSISRIAQLQIFLKYY